MKIAIISDMHIKANDRASNFKRSDKELLALFKKLDDEYEEVYLLGDIIECQQSLWYPTDKIQLKELFRTIEDYKESFTYISGRNEKFFYISGNHDCVMHANKGLNYPKELSCLYVGREHKKETPMGELVFRHGEERHLYDKWKRFFLWFGTWLHGLWERVIPIGMPFSSRSSTDKYPLKLFRQMCEKNDNLVMGIFGHNHIAETNEIMVNGKKRIYVNSGYVNKSAIHFAEVDTCTLNAQNHTYTFEEIC